MNIFLVDHTLNIAQSENCDWFRSLGAAFGNSFKGADSICGSVPPLTHTAYNDCNAVIFAHSKNKELWRQKADLVSCQIIIVRSHGRQGKEENVKGNLHGCYWSPGEWELKSRPEVSRLIEQIGSVDVASDIDWSLLEAPRSEELLALRLLCEAWKFTGGNEEKTVNGITVYAPANPVDWFKPFGLTPPSRSINKSEEETKRFHTELAPLVSLMGDAQNEAQRLLTAVVNEEDLEMHAENFLKKVVGTKQGDTNPTA